MNTLILGITALMTACATFVGAIVALVKTLRKADKVVEKVQEIHVLVNGRMTDAIDRINQLTAALEHAGEDVPRARGKATPTPEP